MKRLITIVAFLLFTLSSTAQVYRSGGFFGMGNSTRYGGGGGGGQRSSQVDDSWFIRVGGSMSNFSSEDVDKVLNFEGVGGNFEIGKGSYGLGVEYLTLDVNGVKFNQLRYSLKRRQYIFGNVYLSTGIGFANLNDDVDDTESVTELFAPIHLGVDFNIGSSLAFFIETGAIIIDGGFAVVITSDGTTSSASNIKYDGVKAGLKFRL
ncbi:MAG: hypothetical protein ACPGSD_13840 [Flavobacteriales bacterium]